MEKSGGHKCYVYYLRSESRVWYLRVAPELPKPHRSSRFLRLPPEASIILRQCNGGDDVGVTAGDDCTAAVAGALGLVGVLVGAVATAGVTAGASCNAGGDSKPLPLKTLRAAIRQRPLWVADMCGASAQV